MNIFNPIDNACIKLIMVRSVLELIVRHTLHILYQFWCYLLLFRVSRMSKSNPNHALLNWIAFCRCSHAIWIASGKIANLSEAIHIYCPRTAIKCDSILIDIFTSFHNKGCRNMAYFNTKMSSLSDFKRTKSTILRTVRSRRRMTNWTKSPCDPVQMIQIKDWYF